MRKRRRPINWFNIALLVILIAAMIYVNRIVIPTSQNPFLPTPTATRDPEAYASEAETFFKDGKLLQAIDSYTSAIQSNPNDPGYYVALARVQIYSAAYEDALSSAEKALLLNPNNSMAYAYRGWALNYLGDYLEAESALKSALEIDSNNATAYAIYAEVLGEQYVNDVGTLDNIDRAIEASNVAMRLAPNTLEVRSARGFILYITDNYPEAITEYEAAIAINGNIPDLHLQLGILYRASLVYDQAVTEFTRANALNPADPTPDLYISRTYGTIGEFAKAEQYAKQAVTDSPKDAYMRGNWGFWLWKNLQWPEAVQQLGYVVNGGTTEDGVIIEPLPLVNDLRIIEYYYTYALALAYTNRCSDVLDVAQTIVNTIPSDEIAVYNAQESLRICQENIGTASTEQPPAETETPGP